MADDVKPEGTSEGAKPALDQETLLAEMDKRMKANMMDFVRQTAPATVREMEPQPAPIADPVGDMIRQHVGGDIRSAIFRAESAEDKADFYLDNGDAREYKEEIEKTFQNLAKANRAMPRADIFNYIKGRDADKFFEKKVAAREAKLKAAAEESTTVGESARRSVGRPSSKDPYGLSEEDLGKAVDGVQF